MEYALVLLGYLLGAIPFGLLFGKCLGVDVRAAGSGNIGATNVNRLLGKKIGALTLVADAAKAVLPMLAAAMILRGLPGADLWVALVGAAAFVGHIYPVYLGFKGGKGVATALGIFFYIQPLAVLICVLAFAVVVWLWGYVSLGSIIAAALMPVLLALGRSTNIDIALAVFIAVLIWLKHIDNIRRLLRHEENSLKVSDP
jgi:glycerol-3-phosphate acyltransferase PlsY